MSLDKKIIEWQDIGGLEVATTRQHRFGTDAVLLESFALSRPAKKICDIGSGCGIIPFLTAKRKKNCEIVALEIQEDAVELINEAVLKNGIDNVRAVCGDARDISLLKQNVGNTDFDLVICNPPYYKENSGAKCPDAQRSLAREENTFSIYDAALSAKTLLKHGGRFCVCFKPERLCDLIDAMRKNTIEPKRLRMIHTRAEQKPWLVLVEGKKGANPFLEVLPPLVVNSESGQNEMNIIYSCIGSE